MIVSFISVLHNSFANRVGVAVGYVSMPAYEFPTTIHRSSMAMLLDDFILQTRLSALADHTHQGRRAGNEQSFLSHA
jgi:hypothetical protein